AKLNAVNAAAVTANERSRRLVRLYEQSAKHHGQQRTWHASYLQFAADCHAEAEAAAELAQKTATRQFRLHLLMGEAAAIVRFFGNVPASTRSAWRRSMRHSKIRSDCIHTSNAGFPTLRMPLGTEGLRQWNCRACYCVRFGKW